MIALGNFFFRYRNGLFPLVFLVAFLVGHPRYPDGSARFDAFLDTAGIVVALLGQALRAVTIGFEYIVRGGKDRRVYADKLVTGGIFAHCRNPLYVGNLLIVFGLALVLHAYAFYLIFIPFILIAYIAIVAAEENFLREKFGEEYEDYCSRVNRWVPDWQGLAASMEGMRFNWRRVLVKEYNTTFVLVAALVALKVWDEYSIAGARPAPGMLATAALLWASLYLAVRTLKKSRLVRA